MKTHIPLGKTFRVGNYTYYFISSCFILNLTLKTVLSEKADSIVQLKERWPKLIYILLLSKIVTASLENKEVSGQNLHLN